MHFVIFNAVVTKQQLSNELVWWDNHFLNYILKIVINKAVPNKKPESIYIAKADLMNIEENIVERLNVTF